jgi:hypothetical protein
MIVRTMKKAVSACSARTKNSAGRLAAGPKSIRETVAARLRFL